MSIFILNVIFIFIRMIIIFIRYVYVLHLQSGHTHTHIYIYYVNDCLSKNDLLGTCLWNMRSKKIRYYNTSACM